MRHHATSQSPARWAPWAAAGLLALLTACASEAPPRAQLAVGQAAVERATGPAAAEAPAELASARDKISRANEARSVRSDRALAAVRDSIRQLRLEMARQ